MAKEPAHIVHDTNGKRDAVTIVSSALVKWLLGLMTLGLVGMMGIAFLARENAVEIRSLKDTVVRLVVKIDGGMDSRWRRSDHDAYSAEVDRRLRILETRPFPFTERKDELLSEAVHSIKDIMRRLSECEAKIKEHENGQRHEDK